ncbi:hypothetical protein R50345_22440 [Paenibacillus sp. FSL R5-0345]|uniref:Uncharacterized protein n=1 Tax=Paenibacillus odorifer TaxID=189426 RepID=A0A1R0Y7Z8_9BACL|nr:MULTISPECIES: hypothetical protein [Paenibacillus]AIQ37160.1 hypothetical protein R50345_22440 [Paenibacillus sp. FSL R5-0345]OMD43485.1 hypothetical protein BSK52_03485 [Paenibacillus odorifer]
MGFQHLFKQLGWQWLIGERELLTESIQSAISRILAPEIDVKQSVFGFCNAFNPVQDNERNFFRRAGEIYP